MCSSVIFFPFGDTFSQTTTFNTSISLSESLLIIWALSFMIQKIKDLYVSESRRLRSKIKLFFDDMGNVIEVGASIGFIIGIILRFIPNNYNCYLASRIILSIDISVWFTKTLDTYMIIKQLGPKLVMIVRMSYELAGFVFIFLIFMFAFGVSTQSLMYHNLPLDWTLIKHVFFPAYFIIGGEYYTAETIMNAQKCKVQDTSRDLTDKYQQTDCPETNGAAVSLFLYTFYLIFLNILLTNLLIAIFSKTYDSIEEESDNVWKSQRYSVIYEYFHKTTLPPPFNVLIVFTFPITFLARVMKSLCLQKLVPNQTMINRLFFYFYQSYNNGFKIYFENAHQKMKFIIWESQIADECMSNEEKSITEHTDHKLHENLFKLNILNKEMHMLSESRLKSVEELDKIEKMLDKVLIQIGPNDGNNSALKDKNIIRNIIKSEISKIL